MRKVYLAISLVITTILVVNIYYYFDIFRQQIDFQKNFLINQTQICSYEIEKRGYDFENDLNAILYSEDLSRFFSNRVVMDAGTKKLEILYSNYSTLISSILLYDNHKNVLNLYKDSKNNIYPDYFTTNTQKELKLREEISHKNGKYSYYIPIFKDNQVTGNIEVGLDFEYFIYDIFSKFHVQDIQWQWLIDENGNIILNNLTPEELRVPDLFQITENLAEGFMGDLQHTIYAGKAEEEVISVYIPTRLLGREFGVVFSLQTDYIRGAIIRNALLIAGITLVLIGLIIFIFLYVIRKKNQEEKKLKESEFALKEIIESLPIGILVLGEDKKIRSINKTAVELFRLDKREGLVGRHLSEKFISGKKIEGKDKLGPAFNANQFIYYEHDGEEMVVYKKEIPLRLKGEEVFLEAVIDITPIEKARKQEAAANQTKSDFLAKMSHEIRTPLHGIIGMTEALAQEKMNRRQQDTFRSIRKSAELLLSIIDDILDFSKIEAGKMLLEEIPFNLMKEVNMVLGVYRKKAAEKGIGLSLKVDPDLPDELIGDPFRLRQVITNLLDNSVKFTPGGEIVLSIELVENHSGIIVLKFTVEDTGIGIPADKLDHIFGSFVQADDSASRKFGGTGLGVTISRQLVEMMNGQIRVESPGSLSTDPGLPGTRFVFTVTVFSNKKACKQIEIENVRKYHQIKTLIVLEKNTTDEHLLKTLQQFGISTYVNFFQDSTIDLIRNNTNQKLEKYKVIIFKHTPSFDAFRVIDRLSEEGLTGQFLIIMVSSRDERNNRIRARRLGVDYYIIEPFESSELFDIIQENFSNIEPDNGESPGKIMKLNREISILVADDNLINQKVAQAIFKNLGFEIDLAAHGNEVIEKVKEKDYDIIFMDLMMPEMDGYEAADRIRKMKMDLPIIAVTADTNQESRIKGNETSMNDFIAKPIKVDEIKRVLIQYLSRSPAG